MRIKVKIDGREFKCTADDPDRHTGRTCPIHEDKRSRAYAPTLGRSLSEDRLTAVVLQSFQAQGAS